MKDFWNFITNENVDLSNIERFNEIIKEEILKQHNNLKIYDVKSNDTKFSNAFIHKLIEWYKVNNGDTLKIKSLKKGIGKK